MKTISFDLGGSGGKLYVGAFSQERLQLTEVHRFKNRAVPMGTGLYWDFLSIYSGMMAGLKKAASLVDPGETATIGIDSFSNDFGLLASNGALLSQIHCYRDQRTQRNRKQADKLMAPQMRHQLTGNQTALCSTLMHLSAIIEEGNGELLKCADKMLLVPDLLAYFLTGKANAEYTVASVTEMYDFKSRNWHEKMLAAYNIPKSLLPDIIMPGTEVGPLTPQTAKLTGLANTKVIAVCEHDTASAYLSAPCAGASMIISSGTWSLIGMETKQPIINDKTYLYNIANEGGFMGPHHRLIKCGMGLWLMQEIQAHFALQGLNYSYQKLDKLGEAAKPFAYLIDPDDDLFFTQGDMLGRIRERCLETYGRAPDTVGEFVRCIKESLALKYRWSLEKLEEVAGVELPVVHVIGGGSKDEVLCQYTADACGRPVFAGPADATALGNAMVQLISCGELASVEQGRQIIRNSYDIKQYNPVSSQMWAEQYRFFMERICREKSI